MRRKKRNFKFLAILLVVAMLLPIGATAIAAETGQPAGNLPSGITENADGEGTEGDTDSSPADISGENNGENDGENNGENDGENDEENDGENNGENDEEDDGNIADTRQDDGDSDSDGHFDVMTPFTLADIEAYNVKMDDAEIPIEHFKLEGENEADQENPCTLTFEDDVTSISGGMIQNQVPAMVTSKSGQVHAFSYAHVGNTRVYYMGTLEIHEGETVENYIYYTTDMQITNKTVYAVLKDGEQISLVYNHGTYYKIEYQLSGDDDLPAGIDMEDDIFGTDRAHAVAREKSFAAKITIPRGYKATVTVKKKDETGEILHEKKLGEMMVYWQPNKDPNKPGEGLNTISLTKDSPTSMVLTDSFSIENVTSDMVVTVQYEKVEEIKFNAYMWTTTARAKNRIQVKKPDGTYETATEGNSDLSFSGDSFTWEFDGITSGTGAARYTWEMDQLQINGERIRVPMVILSNTEEVSETTTMSTGTEVTLTVQSGGGTNGRDALRHYTLRISNCYEDLTISGGNMVGHIHREFAMYRMQGLDSPQVWPNTGVNGGGWSPLPQNHLMDKRNEPYDIATPFRFKRGVGYENMHVRFTTKERGTVLQEDEAFYGTGNEEYIEYLIRKDTANSKDVLEKGEYRIVTYDDWTASDDGFFYFRATKALETFMKANDKNGVILISIFADPIKAGIDYRNGAADDSDTAGDDSDSADDGSDTADDGSDTVDDGSDTATGPLAENIRVMPSYQSGGENGYNIQNNATALVSNQIPMDITGEWAFSHWEILVVENGELTNKSKKKDGGEVIQIHPGDDIHVSEMAMDYLKDCLYRDEDKDRVILTLKAVWEKSLEQHPIPYIVRYVLVDINGDETEIEEHTHTVNEGAMLVTDLYQDANKTLSESIQAVLEGANYYHKDYTLEGRWKVDEKRTTKKISSVSLKDNEAIIYLVKQSTEVTVTKVWRDYDSPARPESIEVQLYKGENELVGNPVTVSEANNWRYTFTGLPEIENGELIVYTVREVTPLTEYTADVSADAETPNQIIITNTRKTGSLTVSKMVEGVGGDTDKAFSFKVTLDNPSVEGTFGEMEFENGIASFTLKHGESKTASGLPTGTSYTVAESNYSGYTVKKSGETGVILAEQTAEAAFVNHKTEETKPPVTPDPDKPTVTPDPEKPTVTPDPEKPTVTPDPEKPTVTPDPEKPTVTPDPEKPTVTPDPEKPTVTPDPEKPTVTPDPDKPTATPDPEKPTVTPDPEKPTVTPDPDKPTATPDPEKPTATPNPTQPGEPSGDGNNSAASPETGDNSNISLWLVLLLAAGGGFTATVVYGRKRQRR